MKKKILYLLPMVTVAIAGFFLLFTQQAAASAVLEFEYKKDGVIPPAQTVNVYNQTATGGAAIVQWRAEGYDSWLDVTPNQGSSSINPGSSTQVSIRPNTSSLGDIGASTTITFTGYDARGNVVTGSGQTVVVNYGFAFIAVKNDPLPESRPVVIKNTTANQGDVISRWSATNYANWLNVSPASGDTDIPAGGSVTLSIQPNTTNLNPGTYTTMIEFTGYDLEDQAVIGSVQKVYVKYIIKHPMLTFSAVRNDGALPAVQNVQIFSTGTPGSAAISSWETGDNASWLSATPGSGSITSGSTGNVAIRPNTNNLTPTTYNTTIKFSGKNAGATTDTVIVDVRYLVTDSCAITDFHANPGEVGYGGSSDLIWTLAGNCSSVKLNGGKFNNTDVTSPQNSGPLQANTAYTLTATGSDGVSDERTIVVLVKGGNLCSITVNAEYDGVVTTPPGSAYTFTLSGPETINGSGPNTYEKPASAQNWIIMYKGGTSATFAGYNQQSQSCSTPGGIITFTLKFTSSTPPPVDPPIASNTAVCDNIRLTWTAMTGASSYKLYRSTVSNDANPALLKDGLTGLQWDDNTAQPATTYYYWLSVVYPTGESAKVKATPASGITVKPCGANFDTSNKIILKVNGKDYKVNSACRIPNQDGVVSSIKKGDRLTLAINICNTGTVDATNVVVRDPLNGTNLTLADRSSIKFNGTSGTYTESGNVFTFNLGTVKAGKNVGIEFDVLVTPPSDSTQKLLRLRNIGEMIYSTSLSADNGGCSGKGTDAAHPCRLDTGYIVFSNGLKSPEQIEVNP
jgi:uncharacterized repeat protein (TIGR01451 family)